MAKKFNLKQWIASLPPQEKKLLPGQTCVWQGKPLPSGETRQNAGMACPKCGAPTVYVKNIDGAVYYHAITCVLDCGWTGKVQLADMTIRTPDPVIHRTRESRR